MQDEFSAGSFPSHRQGTVDRRCVRISAAHGPFQTTGGAEQIPGRICDAADLACIACSGINGENFSGGLGDCFDITEFHMQMENGREMLLLARLRSETEILVIEVEEMTGDDKLKQQLAAKLNQIVNVLSQMICKAMGGKECQRKD